MDFFINNSSNLLSIRASLAIERDSTGMTIGIETLLEKSLLLFKFSISLSF